MLRRIQASLERYGYRISKQKSRVGLYENLRQAIIEWQLIATKRTLNIGSGGEIEKVILEVGGRPTSIDIDPERKPDIVGCVEDLSQFSDEYFDGIFCMEVLEHVQEPFVAAKELTRVLKKGGVLIGSTPFILGVHDLPHDYWRFTENGIRKLFKEMEVLRLLPRNDVFDASETLVWRLFSVGNNRERAIMAWRLPLLLILMVIRRLIAMNITNYAATTGYFFVLRKKP